MRLKSLKLSGFKSFANPTTFTFRHDVTAIVGPNGCGKSNVIDAIRWVLGESSAKQLRGGAMSDVIFAGTQNKAAKSLASVELTFEHTQNEQTGIRHELNLYHELAVRRQVNAEGKSDYFINGSRCRRRDVVDVFLGTGLGPRSYAVIQQGMIGRIVDSNPMQLREFIEEAAGVSRYQARREETQKKLLKTQENLERLDDIKAELVRQSQKLIKQADSARSYLNLQEALQRSKEQITVIELQQAKAAEMQYKQQQQDYAAKVDALQLAKSEASQKLVKLSKQLAEEQWLKESAQDQLHQHDMSRQQQQHDISTLEASLNQVEERRQGNVKRQSQIMSDIAKLEGEAATDATSIAALTPQLQDLQLQREQSAARLAPMQAAWEVNRQEIAQLQVRLKDLEQQLALIEQAQQQRQQQLTKWQIRDNAWQIEAAEWQWDAAGDEEPNKAASLLTLNNPTFDTSHTKKASIETATANSLATVTADLASVSRQRDAILDRLDEVQPQLTQLSQALASQQTTQADLDKQHASLLAEYNTLHAIVHRTPTVQTTAYADTSTDTDAFVNNMAQRLAQLPTLADTIQLSEQGQAYAEVLDRWLAFWLACRIADNTGKQNLPNAAAQVTDTTTATQTKLSWLARMIESVLTDANNEAANSTNTANATQTADSVFFSTTAIRPVNPMPTNTLGASNPAVLIPLAPLIAKPRLAIFAQCYLYVAREIDNKDNKDNKDNEDSDTQRLTAEVTAMLDTLQQGAMILTTSGWLISKLGMVHVSKFGAAAQNESFLAIRLQQQQRLDTLETLLNKVEAQLETLTVAINVQRAQHEHHAIAQQEASAQLDALLHRQHALKQQHSALTTKLLQQQKEQARLIALKQQLVDEQHEITQALQDLAVQKQQAQAQHGAWLPKLNAAEATQTTLEQARQAVDQQQRQDNDAYAALQLELNRAQLANKHRLEQLSSLQTELARLQAQQATWAAQSAKAQQSLPKLQASKAQLDAACAMQTAVLAERQAVINGLQRDIKQRQEGQQDTETQLQALQVALADASTQVAIASERILEARARLQALQTSSVASGQGQQQGGVSADAVLADIIAHGSSLAPEKALAKLQQLQQKEQQLTRELQTIGPVNLAAAAELAAINERLQPLEQQIEDIRASMQKLVDAITEIDAKTKILFLQTLDAVNASLTELFTKVFGGGQASLTLVQDASTAQAMRHTPNTPSEQWRAGLELMAQPKGKKNSRLAVLSGGEKTLTALSLIFAIFKQHPAPFCVLDEVDAPLDDANVSRFTNLIKDLAQDVQFIFISHNKLAMQIADELKGITMPQAGVSSLVSVSLEEAAQYVDASD